MVWKISQLTDVAPAEIADNGRDIVASGRVEEILVVVNCFYHTAMMY